MDKNIIVKISKIAEVVPAKGSNASQRVHLRITGANVKCWEVKNAEFGTNRVENGRRITRSSTSVSSVPVLYAEAGAEVKIHVQYTRYAVNGTGHGTEDAYYLLKGQTLVEISKKAYQYNGPAVSPAKPADDKLSGKVLKRITKSSEGGKKGEQKPKAAAKGARKFPDTAPKQGSLLDKYVKANRADLPKATALEKVIAKKRGKIKLPEKSLAKVRGLADKATKSPSPTQALRDLMKDIAPAKAAPKSDGIEAGAKAVAKLKPAIEQTVKKVAKAMAEARTPKKASSAPAPSKPKSSGSRKKK